MTKAALSAEHVACLIIAAFKSEDWREQEQNAVKDGNIPFCYTSSRERMDRAEKMPQVRAPG